jgi:hypothetical protein
MKKITLLLPLISLVVACGAAETKDAPPSSTEKKEETQKSAPAPFVPKGDLNDVQKTASIDMYNLMLGRAIAQRISEKCPAFAMTEATMEAERNRIIEIAKKNFASNETFMATMGEDGKSMLAKNLQQFFENRDVSWNSSEEAYCKVGKDLVGKAADGGQYLKAK